MADFKNKSSQILTDLSTFERHLIKARDWPVPRVIG